MSIEPIEMKRGLVVRDTKAPTKRTALFRLVKPHGPDGPWPAEQCATGTNVMFTYSDLDRLVPIGDRIVVDVNMNALVGQKVEIFTTDGFKLNGTLRAIETRELTINGEAIQLPVAFSLDSERYRLEVVRSVTITE